MRVCVLTSSYPRFEGDIAGLFIRDLCEELAGRGIAFTVVAPGDEAGRGAVEAPGIRAAPFRYAAPRSAQRLAYGAGIEDNLARHPLRAALIPPFMASSLIAGWKASRGCDLVWSHWLLPSGLAGAAVAAARGLPHCLTVHSAPPAVALRATRPLLERAAVTAVTASLAKYVAETAGLDRRRVRTIPMGVRPSPHPSPDARASLRMKYGLRDELVILFMGRLVPIKGVDMLVRAVRRLPNSLLVIAGEGPCAKEIRELCRATGVRTRFEGFIGSAKKLDWLTLCDIFALPSVPLGNGRTEGAPVSLMEALAAGVPVVASRTGGIEEMLDNGVNCLLVPPGDPAALADAIETLRDDPPLRARIAAAARESASRFRIEKIADEYEKLFMKMLRA